MTARNPATVHFCFEFDWTANRLGADVSECGEIRI